MFDPLNYRKYRRISVGAEHTVSFRIGTIIHNRVPISNLSAGGCFAILAHPENLHLHPGFLLMDFVLEHRDLPDEPICSKVVRVVVGLSEITENDLGLGISFLSTSPQFYECVDSYVASQLDTRQ